VDRGIMTARSRALLDVLTMSQRKVSFYSSSNPQIMRELTMVFFLYTWEGGNLPWSRTLSLMMHFMYHVFCVSDVHSREKATTCQVNGYHLPDLGPAG
jgi:hypothetical protein